jgi:predicted Ser/Thr protein kinase
VPSRLAGEQAKELRANIGALYHESDVYPNYEGRTGASPREMRGVILDAAQHAGYKCLSPFAVLERIADLCNRKSEFEWLRQETVAGGYHDPKYFQKVLRDRLVDRLEDEMRSATGLVDEARYVEGFERYVFNVSAQMKGEKIRNKLTGRDDPPDEAMMKDIERQLVATGTPEEFRRNVISRVAAWAIDHSGQKVPYATLFPNYIQRLKEVFFQEHRKQVVLSTRDLMVLITDEGAGLDADGRRRAEATLAMLKDRYGYCDHCAGDAAGTLLRERFADLKV